MSKFQSIKDVEIPEKFYNRMLTGDAQMDAIFGSTHAGIVPGAAMAISAKRGCGKTTLGFQICNLLASNNYKTVFVSGEESKYQLAFNCNRLGFDNDIAVHDTANLEEIVEMTKEFDFIVLDSFQLLTTNVNIAAYTKREKYMIDTLIKAADDNDCAILIILHQTKDGKEKCTSYVPHAVQVVMYIQHDKELGGEHRTIIVDKNRYGATDEYKMILTGDRGYIFSEETPKEDETVVERVPISTQRKELILKMIDPPHITMKRVMEELEIQKQTAYVLLKELETEGKIVKFGRGELAIWKRSDIDNKSFLEECVSTLRKALR